MPGDELLDLLDAIAPALRAGMSSAAALELAVGSAGQRRANPDLLAASRSGEPLAPVWRRLAQRTGSAQLQLVASAWELSERHGAPLAEAVELTAGLLRDRRRWQGRVDVATAGPRATIRLLSLLPAAGAAFALVFGMSPVELYLGSPVARVAALCGLALTGLGRLWCARVMGSLRRAAIVEPGPNPPPAGARVGGAP